MNLKSHQDQAHADRSRQQESRRTTDGVSTFSPKSILMNHDCSTFDNTLGASPDRDEQVESDLAVIRLESARQKAIEGDFRTARKYLDLVLQGDGSFGMSMKEEAGSILAFVSASQGKWNEAEEILETLNRVRFKERMAQDALHILARARLNEKAYGKAKRWCETLECQRKNTLGKNHILTRLATNLLVEIYDATDQSLDARARRGDLPSNLQERETNSDSGLIAECYEIELSLFCQMTQRSHPSSRTREELCGETLELAASRGHILACELLLEIGVNQKSLDNALLNATDQNELLVARFLVSRGANVEATDSDHGTSLLIALRNQHYALVEFLLDNGADVNIADENGATALELAINDGNLEIVQKILQKEAKLETRSSEGETPLLIAIRKGDINTVKALLIRGAEIDDTALHRASRSENTILGELLRLNASDRKRKLLQDRRRH